MGPLCMRNALHHDNFEVGPGTAKADLCAAFQERRLYRNEAFMRCTCLGLRPPAERRAMALSLGETDPSPASASSIRSGKAQSESPVRLSY